jgi:hypothetical protein
MWIIGVAFGLLCAILVYDYAAGDPRMSWSDLHTPAKPLTFKQSAKS